MSRPLPPGSLSLTGGGAALVTDAGGSIEPSAVAGLIVDDVRILSTWRIDPDVPSLPVGHERIGPSSDRLLWTLRAPDSIDPVGTLERTRSVTGTGLTEDVTVTAYVRPITCSLRLVAGRDDCPVHELGDDGDGVAETGIADGDPAAPFLLPSPGAAVHAATLIGAGWRRDGDGLRIDVRVEPGRSWRTTVSVGVGAGEPSAGRTDAASPTTFESAPGELATAIATGRADLSALTRPVDGRLVFGAGSPFFLALFGRDSLISGMQALVDAPARLLDILTVLAHHQATATDATTRAQPGQILHELRLGRAGVFGVAPGTPYFGAVDTPALFVVALGEAVRWGAAREDIAGLLPAARAALAWCRESGDVDGDGFIESVPHPSGLTNLGWKDSSDSMARPDGSTVVGVTTLPEVQAYWYRAARSFAEIEQWLEVGDGAEALAEADRLARDFAPAFVFDSLGEPFVGLALDEHKELLAVRASNAGHVLWSGILTADVALRVARALAAPDLFSGWGVRTFGADEPGYNPFGYHRGSVWPHDTGFALHGAARYGDVATVRTLAAGLTALGEALGGQLPELLSGISRDDVGVPIPYAAACRPQAWAAGTPLVVLRGLLGLEPDVPAGLVRVHSSLPADHEITVRRMRLGEHELSLRVRGSEVVGVESSGLDVVSGPDAILANSRWGPAPSALGRGWQHPDPEQVELLPGDGGR